MPRKNKTDPVETRLRQVLVELLHAMDPEDDLDADERGEIVTAALKHYGPAMTVALEAFVALTMRELEAEDVDDDEDDGEDD